MMMESRDNHLPGEDTESIYTVSELSEAIRQSLESEFPQVTVLGEIANFTAHSSGHFYFTLRDESGRLGAVVFSRNTRNVDFAPEDGMTAVATGRISHYGGGGRTQLIAVSLRRAGEGELELGKRRLLARLMDEGLTDPGRKRDLPRYPEKIAIITSPGGAAIKDIRRTLDRRWPVAETVLIPAAVQGDAAGGSIVEAFDIVNGMDDIDVVILARGGGSAGDLWTFNTEAVARSVAGCRFPVVTGIGHEIDTSVCDYVSDLSAATPTAAAEVVSPDAADVKRTVNGMLEKIASLSSMYARRRLDRVEFMLRSSAFPAIEHFLDRSRLELGERLDRLDGWHAAAAGNGRARVLDLGERLRRNMTGSIHAAHGGLSAVAERLARLTPAGGVEARRERLEKLINTARMTTEGGWSAQRSDLEGKIRTLKGLGPNEVLGRGYTFCTAGDGRTIISSVDELEEGGRISVNFHDGDAGCLVESRRKDGQWQRRSRSKTQ